MKRSLLWLILFLPVSALFAADKKETNVFPALGIVAERKVEVPWNRFYDHAGLSAILKKLHVSSRKAALQLIQR